VRLSPGKPRAVAGNASAWEGDSLGHPPAPSITGKQEIPISIGRALSFRPGQGEPLGFGLRTGVALAVASRQEHSLPLTVAPALKRGYSQRSSDPAFPASFP
jgi:hypothetical protein